MNTYILKISYILLLSLFTNLTYAKEIQSNTAPESLTQIILPAQQPLQSPEQLLDAKLIPDLMDLTGSETIFTHHHEKTKTNKTQKIFAYLTSHSWPLTICIFFLLGILLSFTPCVLPLLPITVNIIVGTESKNSQYKAVMLVGVYVLSTAICYTIAGVAAASYGATIQIFFQEPWFILFICSLITAFAIIQLEIVTPKIYHTLSAKLHVTAKIQNTGSFISAIIMGATSALALSPCATPALIGILTYISQTGKPWLGGAALFSMSIGMGIPLILVALIGKHVLPKAGEWLHTIKHLTGLLLLGMVIWLLGRILDSQTISLLWAGLMILTAIYLGVFNFKRSNSTWEGAQKLLGIVLMICAVFFIKNIMQTYYLQKADNTECLTKQEVLVNENNSVTTKSTILPTQQITHVTNILTNTNEATNTNQKKINLENRKVTSKKIAPANNNVTKNTIKSTNTTTTATPNIPNNTKPQNTFQAIRNMEELKQALYNNKQPTILYFHANWCTYCRKLDSVFKALITAGDTKNFTLLQVDLTNNTDAADKILARYKVFGLPSVLFFTASGIEQTEFRLSEALSVDELKQHLNMVISSP